MRAMMCVITLICVNEVKSHGMLLLYKPRDISNECAFSKQLRYDVSYGMGMSDTMTLVLHTLQQVDYSCTVDIVSEPSNTTIIVMLRFPTSLAINCAENPDAFKVLKKEFVVRICDYLGDRDLTSRYFAAAVQGRFRFTFLSNSSINADLKAKLYQVTVTTARRKPETGCTLWNETACTVGSADFCFTTGVVCDGIRNCGTGNWFDERKELCGLPTERLGLAPVVAIAAAILCALLAAGHILLRCLPPLANSFFVFNTNEDNRLYVDPLFASPTAMRPGSLDDTKRTSLIPVSSSSSDGTSYAPAPVDESLTMTKSLQYLDETQANAIKQANTRGRRATFTSLRCMTEKFQKQFRSKKAGIAKIV